MPKLVFRNGGGSGGVLVLDQDQIAIGRHHESAIVIDDPCVSKLHAQLERTESGEYQLRDLSSDNGTFVNNRAITTAKLRHGDTIRLGVWEAEYEDLPGTSAATSTPLDDTQRITLEALVEESAGFWTATVENRRRELEDLERRIDELRHSSVPQSSSDAEESRHASNLLHEERKSLEGDVARLEHRREELQQDLLRTDEELRQLKAEELPSAQTRLEEVRSRIAQSQRQLRDLENQMEESQRKLEGVSGLRDEIAHLKEQIAILGQRYQQKTTALETVTTELQRSHEQLDDARQSLERATGKTNQQLDVAARARDEHEDLLLRNQAAVAAIKAAEHELGRVQDEVREAEEHLDRLSKRHEQTQASLRLGEEKLAIHADQIEQQFSCWDTYRQSQIESLAQEKQSLRRETEAARHQLQELRTELDQQRALMGQERQAHQQTLEELRSAEYEPTRQLCETLTLRNEELARSIDAKERYLTQLQSSIGEAKVTERLVADSLTSKGQTLKDLEQRIGAEVERISAAAKGTQAPTTKGDPPRLSEFGTLFFPRDAGPPTAPETERGRRSRTRLVVFDPNAGEVSASYCSLDDFSLEAPLPVGFRGLAAATGGAFETSLSAAVQHQLPVLYIPGADLQGSSETLKRLRAALPSRILLLGWHAETFLAVAETLEQGTNFQELAAMFSCANGNITTDPYMNTFFDSLNQSRRFHYIPPAFPWNPAKMHPFPERQGIVFDGSEYDPDVPDHLSLCYECREIVTATELPLTVLQANTPGAQAFLASLELPEHLIRPDAGDKAAYRDSLRQLESHLALLTFETLRFSSTKLRDALLSRTLLIGRTSEPIQIFFPEIFPHRGSRLLPSAQQIRSILGSEANYNRVVSLAERKLFANYSYQATARTLDQFVDSLT